MNEYAINFSDVSYMYGYETFKAYFKRRSLAVKIVKHIKRMNAIFHLEQYKATKIIEGYRALLVTFTTVCI